MRASVYTNKEALLDKALAALGIDRGMKTDPVVAHSILKEMRLDDLRTKFPPMKKFLVEVTSEPQALGSLFENIQQAIIHKHPAIIEFVEVALNKDWLEKSEHVHRAVHVTFILEHITAAMCNNHGFFAEVHDHIRAKERLCGIDAQHLVRTFLRAMQISHSLFESLKSFSVDPAVAYMRLGSQEDKVISKAALGDLYLRAKINYLEYKILCPAARKGLAHVLELLQLNIYEAGISEFENGYKTKSISAFELNEDISVRHPRAGFQEKQVLPVHAKSNFYDSIATNGNLFATFHLTQQWTSLYTSWNMAFVLSEIDNLDIVFPKLLIPTLIDAESDNFIGIRYISLWLTINTFVFRKVDATPCVLGPENKKETAQAWAKINKKYAFELAQRETHENSRRLMAHYHKMFSRPIRNFLRLLKHFLS
ncbi:MAG: hypothetical protein HY225_01125 [Candidatus Vogelbacteria bacterium]|nr:hypothetical protein [Candidatus Vogelbacteria bacterium]